MVIFGAGGPLGSAVTSELAGDYTLRLTDVQPFDALAKAEPQSPGAPLPVALGEPHAWRVVDVRNGQQVLDACDGMDAIINCSVVRYGDENAFRVNTVGAYNVMRAAVAHGIRRVVHTGPFMLGDRGAFGYDWDEQIVDDVPPRPGIGWIYFPSKHLGQAICRIFAEHHGLSVPALTFCEFYNPDVPRSRRLHPLAISWQDAARAIRARPRSRQACRSPLSTSTLARICHTMSSPTKKPSACWAGSHRTMFRGVCTRGRESHSVLSRLKSMRIVGAVFSSLKN